MEAIALKARCLCGKDSQSGTEVVRIVDHRDFMTWAGKVRNRQTAKDYAYYLHFDMAYRKEEERKRKIELF